MTEEGMDRGSTVSTTLAGGSLSPTAKVKGTMANRNGRGKGKRATREPRPTVNKHTDKPSAKRLDTIKRFNDEAEKASRTYHLDAGKARYNCGLHIDLALKETVTAYTQDHLAKDLGWSQSVVAKVVSAYRKALETFQGTPTTAVQGHAVLRWASGKYASVADDGASLVLTKPGTTPTDKAKDWQHKLRRYIDATIKNGRKVDVIRQLEMIIASLRGSKAKAVKVAKKAA